MCDLKTVPLAELITQCQAQTLAYLRTKEAGDDRYCLELYRRAVQEGDQRAWAFIYTFYSTEEFLGDHYLLKWIGSWMSGHHGPAIRASYTEEEIVQEIWLRFMRSEAAQQFNFPDMRRLMAYLRRLVNNFIMDAVRRRLPEVVDPRSDQDAAGIDMVLRTVPDSHQAVDQIVLHQEALDALMGEIVGAIVSTPEEWLVFRGYFLDELPPRKLYRLHPGVFAHGQVETIRTRLVRRLRKAPHLLSRYIKIVVLHDDERQRVVFEQALMDGADDSALLDTYPGLFVDALDVLATKIRVVEALRSRPLLLKFLALDGAEKV